MKWNLKLILILMLLEHLKKLIIKINIVDEKNKKLKNVIVYGRSCTSNQWLLLNSCNYSWVMFNDVPKGNMEFIVYKDGYYLKSFRKYFTNNHEFTICICKIKVNRVYGIITDYLNKSIENAVVILYKVIEEDRYCPMRFTKTDFLGEYNFVDVPRGTYIIKAIK